MWKQSVYVVINISHGYRVIFPRTHEFVQRARFNNHDCIPCRICVCPNCAVGWVNTRIRIQISQFIFFAQCYSLGQNFWLGFVIDDYFASARKNVFYWLQCNRFVIGGVCEFGTFHNRAQNVRICKSLINPLTYDNIFVRFRYRRRSVGQRVRKYSSGAFCIVRCYLVYIRNWDKIWRRCRDGYVTRPTPDQ